MYVFNKNLETWRGLVMIILTVGQKGHMAILVATEMAHQHNAALRGLNAMYLQAPHVHAPQDIADFFFLMQCWGLWVQHYDDLRRKRMFPTFEEILHKPGCILSRLRGDLEFKPSLNRLLDYVKETHPRVETYDPRIYQELIMKFGLIYQAHLANTICILCALPQICGPPGSSGTDARAGRLYQAYRSLDREASEVMDPNIVPPMLVRMRDTTYEGGNDWPGLPLVAVHVIAEKLSKLHAGAWRFLPCDVWGKPKELPFMGYEAGKGKQRAVPAIPARSPRRLRHEADIVETG